MTAELGEGTHARRDKQCPEGGAEQPIKHRQLLSMATFLAPKEKNTKRTLFLKNVPMFLNILS